MTFATSSCGILSSSMTRKRFVLSPASRPFGSVFAPRFFVELAALLLRELLQVLLDRLELVAEAVLHLRRDHAGEHLLSELGELRLRFGRRLGELVLVVLHQRFEDDRLTIVELEL